MVISGVRDLAEGTIGLQQRVFSLDDITIAALMLGFVITGMGVLHGVGVMIFRVGLLRKTPNV